jgi:hypothetical protein
MVVPKKRPAGSWPDCSLRRGKTETEPSVYMPKGVAQDSF